MCKVFYTPSNASGFRVLPTKTHNLKIFSLLWLFVICGRFGISCAGKITDGNREASDYSQHDKGGYMARQRTSPVEEVIVLSSKLPWWVCLILALVSYGVLHVIATTPLMAPVTGQEQPGTAVSHGLITTMAIFGQYILAFAFCMAAILSAITASRQKKLYNTVATRTDIAALNEMSWQEFEMLVGEHFRRQGFQVSRQEGTGPDGGADLVLKNRGETYLVQCKHWKSYKVGVQPVRELYGVMAARGAAGGYVVTPGVFTDEALEFTKGLNIELIDGRKLRQLIVDR